MSRACCFAFSGGTSSSPVTDIASPFCLGIKLAASSLTGFSSNTDVATGFVGDCCSEPGSSNTFNVWDDESIDSSSCFCSGTSSVAGGVTSPGGLMSSNLSSGCSSGFSNAGGGSSAAENQGDCITGVGESATSMILGIVKLPNLGLPCGLLPSSGPIGNFDLMGESGTGLAVGDLGLPNLLGVGIFESLVVG